MRGALTVRGQSTQEYLEPHRMTWFENDVALQSERPNQHPAGCEPGLLRRRLGDGDLHRNLGQPLLSGVQQIELQGRGRLRVDAGSGLESHILDRQCPQLRAGDCRSSIR